MSHATLRRRSLVGLESLESRELLAAGGPSAEAQYMLELINMARTNPRAAAEWVASNAADPDIQATLKYYNVDLNAVKRDIASADPQPALAWNDTLADAAIKHSLDQANAGVQSHTGTDGSTLDQRLDRSGYGARTAAGENAYAYAESVDHAMEAFLVDWGVADHGHRNNLLQPNADGGQVYKEVGIGIIKSNRPGVGPKVITQNFGTPANGLSYITGVAYSDDNGNNRYDMGEGRGDVQIDVTNLATGETRTTYSWDQGGGYQVAVPAGAYSVTAKVNGQVVRSDRVNVGDQNVKVDYDLTDKWQRGPVSVPAPVVSRPTTPPPVNFTFSNASTVAAANVAAQTLAAPTRTAAAKTSGWAARWNAWSARRV